jgi:hypothetical protein
VHYSAGRVRSTLGVAAGELLCGDETVGGGVRGGGRVGLGVRKQPLLWGAGNPKSWRSAVPTTFTSVTSASSTSSDIEFKSRH